MCIQNIYAICQYYHIYKRIGEHLGDETKKGDEQFEISDTRSVDEVYNAIIELGLWPVMSDYIYV